MTQPASGPMPSDDAHRQARAWLRLFASSSVTEVDAQAFRRWLDADPAHKAAFNEVKQRWAVMKPAAGESLRAQPDLMASVAKSRVSRPQRRAFLGAVMGAAAVTGVAVLHPSASRWIGLDGWGADDRTAVGEQRTVMLAQQATVTLNTQTSIRRRHEGGGVVGIDLLSGEAAIDLLREDTRFSVTAGVGSATAQAGKFEVRYLADKICVTCLEGTVQVVHPTGQRSLGAHQQAIYDGKAISGVANVAPASVAAWRRGEIVFDRVRLADVLLEINRYRHGRVVLMNDAAQDKRVTGRFQIASLDDALSQLVSTFDLNARALPGGLLFLS